MNTKINFRTFAFLALLLSTLIFQPSTSFAQGTAFTYQGRLNASGSPASGSYDFQFSLWSAASGSAQLGSTLTNTTTALSNGLFTVTLDFGANFPGADRWLEIDVRTTGGGAFTTLSPRQKLTPSPYAITAGNAVTATTATSATSASTATTATSFSGALAGNVTGPQSATVVASVGGQTAANVASGVIAANAATSANTASTIVQRDASGNFANNSLTLSGNLNLPATTSTAGIYPGGAPFVHGFGAGNIFAGSGAGNLTMSGSDNVGVGFQALASNTSGGQNTAIGQLALYSNTNGYQNTAVGQGALYKNLSGGANTANGTSALSANTTGSQNTANGAGALESNTNGSLNTANGYAALFFNTSGLQDTASGAYALYNNTSGYDNTANGVQALYNNTNGYNNTANGLQALYYNTSGDNNTAEGYGALFNNTAGSYNIALGYQAGLNVTNGNNNIEIGNAGLAADNNLIRIGSAQAQAFIAGVITGNGGGLTNLSGGQIAAGTVTGTQLGGDVGQWSVNGASVYRNSGGVGILTTNPLATLHVADVRNISLGTPAMVVGQAINTGGIAQGEHLEFDRLGIQAGSAFPALGSPSTLYLNNEGGSVSVGSTLTVGGDATMQGNLTVPAGKVGIGTSTPSNPLSVAGSADFSGRVGIGTTTPRSALDVFTSVSGNMRVVGNGALSAIDLTAYDYYPNPPEARIQETDDGEYGGHLDFFTKPGTLLGSPTNALVQRMRITDFGNVGIGTATPANTLSVAGNSDFSGNVGIGTTTPSAPLEVSSSLSTIFATSYSGNPGRFLGRSAGGTAAAPTATQSGSLLAWFAGDGYTGAGFSASRASIIMNASENWSTSANGAEIAFNTTPNGTAQQATERMRITNAGNVGIGTATPTHALVEINGTAGGFTNAGAYGFLDNAVPTGKGSGPIIFGSASFSLYASGDIGANVYFAFSDERIKHVEGRSDAARDLNTLLGIEVTDYTYIDTHSKGAGKQKKVIAQQVEKVYPQAVSRTTDVVPDIYQKATIRDGWVKLATNLKKGERVRLIGEKKEGIQEVLEVASDGFRTDFAADGNQVFVYGREVKDFRNVDYEAIAMLNVSATQELARKLEAQQAALAKLQARFTQVLAEKDILLKHLAAVEARDQAREDRLAQIENSLNKGAARKTYVSLIHE